LSNYLIFDKQFITYIVNLYNHNSFTEIKNLRWSWPLSLFFVMQEALRFIENEANAKRPFLLYWTPDATHTPLYASEKFRGRSSRGL